MQITLVNMRFATYRLVCYINKLNVSVVSQFQWEKGELRYIATEQVKPTQENRA